MKAFNTKLALSALAVAILATPALAQQQPYSQSSHKQIYNSAAASTDVGTYPNGATRSGSTYSRESGADDNVIR
jgi:hypothetical protein